jgi:segregation and condensation protein B
MSAPPEEDAPAPAEPPPAAPAAGLPVAEGTPEAVVADVAPGSAAPDAGPADAAFSDVGTADAALSDAGTAEAPPEPSAPEPTPAEAPPVAPVTPEALRLAEALLFATDRPVRPERLQQVLPDGQDARAVLAALASALEGRGVVLAEVAGGFAFRTAADLAPALMRVVEVPRRLPRAAMEALAVIAWHQPVTRAEIEEIRGASLSQATLEALLENGLVAPKGHKEVPGRPTLWGTTPRFLEQFGLASLKDLPKREELVSAEAAAPLFSAANAAPAEAEPTDEGRAGEGTPGEAP